MNEIHRSQDQAFLQYGASSYESAKYYILRPNSAAVHLCPDPTSHSQTAEQSHSERTTARFKAV